MRGQVEGLPMRVDFVTGESAPWWWRLYDAAGVTVLFSGRCRTDLKAKHDAIEAARTEARLIKAKRRVLDAVDNALVEGVRDQGEIEADEPDESLDVVESPAAVEASAHG